jgi:hypothetical protein
MANVERRMEESKRECREQVQELTLLQTQGFKLCLAIVGPLRVRSHLSEGMRIATLCHTKMAEELAALRAAISSVAVFVLGCSPNEAFWVEVDELIAKFLKQVEWRSLLERPSTSVCDIILGPPFGQAWLADRQEEAVV